MGQRSTTAGENDGGGGEVPNLLHAAVTVVVGRLCMLLDDVSAGADASWPV